MVFHGLLRQVTNSPKCSVRWTLLFRVLMAVAEQCTARHDCLQEREAI